MATEASPTAARHDPPKSRRIVMLLENFTYPEDTRVRNEAESLAGAGHRVVVLAPRGVGQRSRESLRGVEVRRYRTVWASRSPWSYALEYGIAHLQLFVRSLAQMLRGARALHINGPPDTLAIAAISMRLVGGRVVFDMHDSGPELFEAKFGSSVAIRALRAAQRLAIGCADQVIVTNQTQRDLVLARAPRRFRGEVAIVRNGPRASEFPDPPPARAGQLGSPRLIYVGTLDVQDGVLELADILASPKLAEAHLTIVGDGAAREELVARVQQLGLEARVTFAGHVPHEQVAALIADADIAVDPAPGTELNHGSTMIKIAEYMGCGRPTVAYELRETVRTAASAAMYAPAGDTSAFIDCVRQLADDGKRRLELGALARERALELGWDRSERTLLEVYQRLD
jgi:glycosyltransferase involved in cell wall biosynthesis